MFEDNRRRDALLLNIVDQLLLINQSPIVKRE